MKKYFSILILFLISISSQSFSKENIFFLDLDYVLSNSNQGKLILSDLDKINKQNIEKIKSKEEDLKNEEQEIISQKNILSKEIYSEKVADLKKKIETFKQEKNKLVKDFTNIRQTKINNFLKDINKILEDYVEKNSINLVLNKKDILIGNNEYNITDEILELVNKLD